MPSKESGLVTRSKLLAAARALLIEGHDDFSMQKLADEANVAVGSAYTHFKNKSELMSRVFELAIDEYESFLVEATRGITEPVQMVAHRLRYYGRMQETHPWFATITARYSNIYAVEFAMHRQIGFQYLIKIPHIADALQGPDDSPATKKIRLGGLLANSGLNHLIAHRRLDSKADLAMVDYLVEEMLVFLGVDSVTAKTYSHDELTAFPKQVV